jgi:hypothetical protein
MPTPASAVRLRTVLDVEKALQFAFRDELPKRRDDRSRTPGAFPSVSPMFRLAALGGRVDNWSREPGFPAALGEPHPDALAIETALLAIQPDELDISGFAAQGSCHRAPRGIDVDIIAVAAVEQAVAHAVTCARMGTRPDWGGLPEIEAVRHANGQPLVFERAEETRELGGESYTVDVERQVDRNGKRGLPEGAYSKLRYTPSRVSLYQDRAAYAAWIAVLDLLAERLSGQLETIEIAPPAAPRRPWAGDRDAGQRTVLPSTIAPVGLPRRSVRPARERAA